ncbi:MAG: hypothetical protein R3C99_17735 [Pirellulaceae bacterium]
MPTAALSDSIPRSTVQSLIAELQADPYNVPLHVRLANAYAADNRFEDAVALMKNAVELPTADNQTVEYYEDLQIYRARFRLSVAQKNSLPGGSGDLTDVAEKLQWDLNRLELDIFRRRSERYPQDLALAFGLAARLRLNGKLDEAEPLLTRLLNEPSLRASSHWELGKCKQQQQRLVDALKHFRLAAASCGPDQLDLKKKALHRAGSLAVTMKLTESAREYFQQLVDLDPSYKDAQAQLRKLSS